MKLAVISTVVLLALSSNASAREADERKARELFQRAEVHFSVREFKSALDLYRQAYKVKPLPGFLFNIAQCYRHLWQWKKALFHYRMYLSRLPDAPNKTDVEQLIIECEAETKPREPAGKKSRDPTGTRSGEPATEERGLHRAWFWSGVALSSMLLATAGVCGVLNLTMSSEYNDPATPLERRHELKDTGEALGTVAWVTLGVGAAAAVGTTLLYLYTDFETRPPVAVSPTSRGGTIVVQGRF